MKKLLIALMLVPALLLVSCNPANKKPASGVQAGGDRLMLVSGR